MMRFIRVFFFSFILFFAVRTKAQQTIGVGLGIADADFSKPEADLSLNADYSISFYPIVFDVKQSFRYWGAYIDVTSNSFLLVGITTPTEHLFRFQFMAGMNFGCSLYPNSKYVTGFGPAIKTAFLYRLSQNSSWIVGLEGLVYGFTQTSSDRRGHKTETGNVSLSVIMTAKYLLSKKSKTKKEN